MSPSVTFLGTSHGNIAEDRFSSSILLQLADQKTLVDAGEPCAQRLRSMGENTAELDAVLLTHGHADHTGGLPLLLQAMWGDERSQPLPVFSPGELAGPLGAWAAYCLSLLPPRGELRPDFHAWENGRPVSLGAWEMTPRRTTHLRAPREAFSLEIRAEGRRLLFSGDLGAASDLQPLLSEPADLLVCELAHVTPADLMEVLREARLGLLLLTHLGVDCLPRREEIRVEMSSRLEGVQFVELAEDGLRLEL